MINGGETRLEVSISNFVKLLQGGIWIDPIAPAQIEFGAQPAAIFPVDTVGVADAGLQTATVPHQGGLRIKKASISRSIDATNVTLACLPVAGCRLLNTANNLLPNELAEIREVTFTDDGAGTVTITGAGLHHRGHRTRAQHPVPDDRVRRRDATRLVDRDAQVLAV